MRRKARIRRVRMEGKNQDVVDILCYLTSYMAFLGRSLWVEKFNELRLI
jgi:hypothetical protein